MKKLMVPLVIAAFVAVIALPMHAADDAKPARALPFRGKVDAVDKQAKTFKINERTFTVTSESKIKKDGKEATFDEVAVGVSVTGSSKEGANKKLNVVSLNVITAKPTPAK